MGLVFDDSVENGVTVVRAFFYVFFFAERGREQLPLVLKLFQRLQLGNSLRNRACVFEQVLVLSAVVCVELGVKSAFA